MTEKQYKENKKYQILEELERNANKDVKTRTLYDVTRLHDWKEFLETGKMSFCYVDEATFWSQLLLKNQIPFLLKGETVLVNADSEDPKRVSIMTTYTLTNANIYYMYTPEQ